MTESWVKTKGNGLDNHYIGWSPLGNLELADCLNQSPLCCQQQFLFWFSGPPGNLKGRPVSWQLDWPCPQHCPLLFFRLQYLQAKQFCLMPGKWGEGRLWFIFLKPYPVMVILIFGDWNWPTSLFGTCPKSLVGHSQVFLFLNLPRDISPSYIHIPF